METINDVIEKRFSKSLIYLLKVIDPDRNYAVDRLLAVTWDQIALNDQRKLYLYLLYRKWQGHKFYNSPFEIITNCRMERNYRLTTGKKVVKR